MWLSSSVNCGAFRFVGNHIFQTKAAFKSDFFLASQAFERLILVLAKRCKFVNLFSDDVRSSRLGCLVSLNNTLDDSFVDMLFRPVYVAFSVDSMLVRVLKLFPFVEESLSTNSASQLA